MRGSASGEQRSVKEQIVISKGKEEKDEKGTTWWIYMSERENHREDEMRQRPPTSLRMSEKGRCQSALPPAAASLEGWLLPGICLVAVRRWEYNCG